MLADGDAVELNFITSIARRFHADQSEVGRAATDVADEDQLARPDEVAPPITIAMNPGVECGLRLFDQIHPWQAGAASRRHGQLAGHLVKRCGQRDHDILAIERRVGMRRVPRLPDMGQESG